MATFPQLEYPRPWPAHVHVVGPLMWEPPTPQRSRYRPAMTPLVLIAPSTSQDPDHRLLHAALRGLADAPVRVLATYNRRLPSRPLRVPDNATVVDWVSYARTLPHCDAIVCHAGHGTLVRALSLGVPVSRLPVAGDMNENAARLVWAGAGVRLPRRFIAPRPLRHAVDRALSEPSIRAKAQALASGPRPMTPGPGQQAQERLASETPGVGVEPTTSRLTVERICQLSYPGSCYPGRGRDDIQHSRQRFGHW